MSNRYAYAMVEDHSLIEVETEFLHLSLLCHVAYPHIQLDEGIRFAAPINPMPHPITS
jgi:hypothetical protein